MRKLFSSILFASFLLLSFIEAHAVDVYMYRNFSDSRPWVQFLNARKIVISSDAVAVEDVNGYTISLAFDELSHFTFYSSVVAGIDNRQAEDTDVRFGGDVLTVNASSPITGVSVYSIGGTTCINDAPQTVAAQYSLAHLQKGVYLVKVMTANGIKVTKILKN